MNFAKKILIAGCVSFSLGIVSASVQEGEIVQQEKARREQELRERNAQAKPEPARTGPNTAVMGKTGNDKKTKRGKRVEVAEGVNKKGPPPDGGATKP